MPGTDVSGLVIYVETKGVKESTKELDKLTTSSKKVATQTKKTMTLQEKASESLRQARAPLSTLAAGYYLVTQTIGTLINVYNKLEEAYTDNISSQIKLETIIKSTSNAVGYSYGQIEEMTNAWREATGVHQTIIRDAAGIASTFTQISKDAFPKVIEQALNMSAIFRQDLKQSVVQLGTALNDPIKGVGRLRRIGISFTQSQKDSIKQFIAQNDVLSAQNVILKELEVEIGQVARAMGQDIPGDIKRFESAITDLKIEIGELITTGVNPLRVALTDLIDDFVEDRRFTKNLDSFSDKLAEFKKSVKGDIPTGANPIDVIGLPSALTFAELSAAAKGYTDQIEDTGKKQLFLKEVRDEVIDNSGINNYLQKEAALYNTLTFQQKMLKLINEELAIRNSLQESQKVGAVNPFLQDLEKEIAYRRKLNEADDLGKKTIQGKKKLADDYNTIIEKGLKLGFTQNQIEEVLNGYHSERFLALEKEEKLQRTLLTLREQNALAEKTSADISKYGDSGDRAYEKYKKGLSELSEAERRGAITTQQYLEAQRELRAEFESFSTTENVLARYFDAGSDAAERFIVLLGQIKTIGADLATGATVEGFKAIGESLAGSETASDDFVKALKDMTAQALLSASPMFVAAAAREAAIGNYPLAATYLALAAATGIGGGALAYSAEDASSGGGNSSTTLSGDITYAEQDYSDSFSQDANRMPNLEINTVNNTPAEASTNVSRGPGGKLIVNTIVAQAVDKVGDVYPIQRSPIQVG